jgi:hypothetical protein
MFVEVEEFRWEEFLLYNESEGYRWLIADEGVWRLGAPVNGGDIDTSRFPDAVKHKEKVYKLRNQGTAQVVFVLGEFYWRVEVGENVLSHDFELKSWVLSREAAGTEINWTLAKAIDAALIAATFGLDKDHLAAALPAEASGYGGGGLESFSGGAWAARTTARWLLVGGVFLLFMFLGVLGKCGSGDDDSGSVRGGWSGGFGGK